MAHLTVRDGPHQFRWPKSWMQVVPSRVARLLLASLLGLVDERLSCYPIGHERLEAPYAVRRSLHTADLESLQLEYPQMILGLGPNTTEGYYLALSQANVRGKGQCVPVIIRLQGQDDRLKRISILGQDAEWVAAEQLVFVSRYKHISSCKGLTIIEQR